MNIKPLGDRVLLKPIKQELRTASGIYLTEDAIEKKKQAEVITIGDGPNIKVQPGDKVIYSGYVEESIKVDNQELIIIDIKNIIAKIIE